MHSNGATMFGSIICKHAIINIHSAAERVDSATKVARVVIVESAVSYGNRNGGIDGASFRDALIVAKERNVVDSLAPGAGSNTATNAAAVVEQGRIVYCSVTH